MNPDKFPETYEENRKKYNSFMVNKMLGRHNECVLAVNEISIHGKYIPAWMQYEFYRILLPKKKRYAQKMDTNKEENLDVICEFYNCNRNTAHSYLKNIDDKTISDIKKYLYKGGLQK